MTESTSDQGRPFLSAPCARRYFAAGSIEEARQRIVRAIVRNEGPAMLIGGAGTGKSLLLAVLEEQFASRVAAVALDGAQLCTRRALLQTVLCELGLAYRGMDEGELRLALIHYLRGADATPAAAKPQASRARRLLLLVDEADALPVRLLEELRVLTNVAAQGLPLVSLVLAGGPILEERFADPQLDGFAQRIAARCYLSPLGREETLQYLRSQVASAGMRPERLFTAEALEAVYAATGGLPRLINQLGDQLTWMAEETGCAPLDAALVQQAWSDLQQLPAPWDTEGHAAAAGPSSREAADVIEFGELDAACELDVRALDGGGVEDDVLLDDFDMGAADEEADDDRPASIPIASARIPRLPFEKETPDETLATTERLLAEYDGAAAPEKDYNESEPNEDSPPESPAPPAAENPFEEPFDEEEIVVDPYRAFEADLRQSAPQVWNRLECMFAEELQRCVQRAAEGPMAACPAAIGTTTAHAPAVAEAAADAGAEAGLEPCAGEQNGYVRLHEGLEAEVHAPLPTSSVLVIEEDGPPRAMVVEGRQFRHLFSALEAGSGEESSQH
ncbi:MAG: AAA family ATPase [Pirellulales bacterium]|nr:AAA family ATPase [Pirellulales bacterium]